MSCLLQITTKCSAKCQHCQCYDGKDTDTQIVLNKAVSSHEDLI